MAKRTNSETSGSTQAHGNGTAPPMDPAIAALGYEDAVRELEQLVESIERGDVGLEASLAAYRKGEQLLRHCKGLLDKAELTVRELSLSEAEGLGD